MRGRFVVPICIAIALLPSASAWSLRPEPTPLSPVGPEQLASAVACALGDVDVDGHADLLVRVEDAAATVQAQALAGPDFTRVLWSRALSPQAILDCAPDLDLDGVADPVIRIAAQATATLPAGQAQTRVVFQTIHGATGTVAVARTVLESAAGAGAEGAAALQHAVQAQLLPAAAGAVAELQTEATTALGSLPAGLPVGALGLEAQAKATLRLIDAAGRVAGTVTIDELGVDPLALAPLPTGALPQVVALSTRAVSQVEGLAARVPTLALHNADGTLAWAVELAATTGVPSLVPRVGDLDLDGIPDLVVQTVTGSLADVPAATLTAVSGLDGHVLFATEAAAGAVAALPLGSIAGHGTALLRATQAAVGGELELSALDVTGAALWSVRVPAGSVAANLAFDAFTGDPLGFTDLTGDGSVDIATAVATNGSLAIQVLDGLTGAVAWNAEVPGAASVLAVARSTVASASQHLADAAGTVSDLVAIGADAGLTVTLLRGTDGAVAWTAKAALATGQGVLDVASAGDLDADGAVDLLLTLGPVAAEGAAEAQAAVSGAKAAVLSTVSGLPLAEAVQGVEGALAFTLEAGPAYAAASASRAEETPSEESPAALLAGVLAALGVAAVLRRRL